MPLTLARWMDFLGIGPEVVDALNTIRGRLEPQIDEILSRFYARILAHEETARLFKDPETIARVRQAQRSHWIEHVFAGRFDQEYLAETRKMGQSHFRLGVDLMPFSASYCLVLSDVTAILVEAFAHDPQMQRRCIDAVHRAAFLDLGLATSVYYEAYVADIEQMSNELIFSLSRAGEYRDNETGRHVLRMGRMCQALALAAGADRAWAERLRVAAPLHDLGKIGIPDSILLKPGPLDAEEWGVMRRHPAIGAEIIPAHNAEVIRMARRVALTHHERWDGGGYPAGLRGEEIPLEGRIASLCDVFDALQSQRPYKEPWACDEALAYIAENSATRFDPRLVEFFLAIQPQIQAIRASFSDAPQAEARGAGFAGAGAGGVERPPAVD